MNGHRDLFSVYRDRFIDETVFGTELDELLTPDVLAEIFADEERAGEHEVERINLGLAPLLWEERPVRGITLPG